MMSEAPPFALTSLGDTLCRLLLPTHRVNGVGECHDGAADKYTHSAAGMDFNPYQWCRTAVLSSYVLMQFDRRAVEKLLRGRRAGETQQRIRCRKGRRKKNSYVCQEQLFECRRAPLRYNKAAVFGESFV